MTIRLSGFVAVICLVLVSRHSDRTLERRYHAALPCLACAAGLASIGLFANYPVIAFTGLIVGTLASISRDYWLQKLRGRP